MLNLNVMFKCAAFQLFSGLIERQEKIMNISLPIFIRNLQGKNLSFTGNP